MELRALAGGGGGGGGGGAYSEALAGGVQDQVLTKNSGSDGDFSWKDSPVRGVPVSAIMTFPTMGVPLGFLKCNGEVKLRTTYPALFDKIGTTYNTGGELLTEFRLPDLRAEFIRGWDDGRGVDVGRIFASSQADMLRSHNHSTFNFYSSIVGSKNISLSPSFASGTTITGTAGGAETRPRNVAMTFAIKAFDSIDAGVVLDLETYVDEKIATAGGGGSSAPGTGLASYAGSVTLNFDTSIGGSGTLTLNGTVQESGGFWKLIKVGNGTLALSGTNSYTGGTEVDAGVLSVKGADALPGGRNVWVRSGGTLDIDASAGAFTLNPVILEIDGTGSAGQGALEPVWGHQQTGWLPGFR